MVNQLKDVYGSWIEILKGWLGVSDVARPCGYVSDSNLVVTANNKENHYFNGGSKYGWFPVTL